MYFLKIVFLFSLYTFSLAIETSDSLTSYDLTSFFNEINTYTINKKDSEEVINTLKTKIEQYVYLDIIKRPPSTPENYYQEVDIITELDQISTEGRTLYEFYRDIKLALKKCKDGHLDILLDEYKLDLTKMYFISPLYFKIEENENEVYVVAKLNEDLVDYFDSDLTDKIKSKSNLKIKSINGVGPIEFIQTFNKNFVTMKSNQAQFVLNFNSLRNWPILYFPFQKTDLENIRIVYDDFISSSLTFSYKVLNTNNVENKLFFNIKNNDINFNLINDHFSNLFLSKNKEFVNKNTINWDYYYSENVKEKDYFKCRVDEMNEVNVIYQNTFVVDFEKAKKVIDNCFSLFDGNTYPIIIIEDFNAGGNGVTASYLQSYINLNNIPFEYASARNNQEDKTKYNYGVKDVDTCKTIEIKNCFNSLIIDDYGINSKDEKVTHERTKIFHTSVGRAQFFKKRKEAKYIRKPTEIIIFTDGYSFSATSSFIKNTQIKGGAIVVGYGGNPNINSFDSSQGPSAVEDISFLGFTLKFSVFEYFDRLDKEDELNIPLEYKIHPIDERITLYNKYTEDNYENFIDEAKDIFKKYNNNGECNKNNPKLLLIDENCDDPTKNTHGGYKCGADGKWSTECVASFCDNGFYYDEQKKECIVDICIKNNSNSLNGLWIIAIILLLF